MSNQICNDLEQYIVY